MKNIRLISLIKKKFPVDIFLSLPFFMTEAAGVVLGRQQQEKVNNIYMTGDAGSCQQEAGYLSAWSQWIIWSLSYRDVTEGLSR